MKFLIIFIFLTAPILGFSGRPQTEIKNTLTLNNSLRKNVKLERNSISAIITEMKNQKKNHKNNLYQLIFVCDQMKCDLAEIALPIEEKL
ncbi:MAG: hypothetical protein QE271_04615 [Bacteriovoracaceae bacterium]|nr:hypothetical protein [Bacteriovoracaceae bacterium]